MYGLFGGLEIGKRALLSSQLAMTTVGHNMANVNTPGFSRQRVSVISTQALPTPDGMMGTGVKVSSVEHIRDLFLTGQYRRENARKNEWGFVDKSMSQIEGFFNEPNENMLGNQIDKFWQAWSDLASNPESSAKRSSLVEHANAMINSFHQLSKQHEALGQSIDGDIRSRVHELNQLGKQIANLNLQISYQELGSQKANDLRDQRDLLIDELSNYVDVTVLDRKNGTSAVLIGAMAFVDGSEYLEIGTKVEAADNKTTTKIVWAYSDVEIKISGGEIKGMLDMRDEVIPSYKSQLDELAKAIVEEVNSIHSAGYGLDGETERNFFDPDFTSAEMITLDIEILNDLEHIAASTNGAVGDGAQAQAIADMLSQQRVMNNDTVKITEYYGSMVGGLGIKALEATSYNDNYSLLVQQIENQRQSVQGVSLDEEMTNLVKFQNSYDAAARVITAMDQALETVINNMGIVGR